MSQPKGAEVLIDILNGYGVEAMFSSPGSEWPPLWEALARRADAGESAPAYYNARHEDLAIGQAMGYAPGHRPARRVPGPRHGRHAACLDGHSRRVSRADSAAGAGRRVSHLR